MFHHFACILLLRYKPDSKFPTRWVRSTLSSTDVSDLFSTLCLFTCQANTFQHKILQHARAICAACKSSMQNAQLLIILCHTVFIWGPLMTSPAERREIVRMLRIFEKSHAWRTEWIVDALKTEWGMD